MELNESQRALLRKGRYLGYERHLRSVFERFGVEAPANWAAFTSFIDETQNVALVNAICAKLESVNRLGRPSVTLYGCAPKDFDSKQLAAAVEATSGQRVALELKGFDRTSYAVQSVEVVEGSLYISLAFSAPTQVIPTWEGLQAISPVNEMVLRYRPGDYYVAMVSRETYSHEIAKDLADRFGLPTPNDVVKPNKRWFADILANIQGTKVRSMAGSTNSSAAKRFSLGADSTEDVRKATNAKIDDITLEVEGNPSTGKVSLMRVGFVVNGQAVTIALNLENDSIVSYNYMDLQLLEALLVTLQQALLYTGAA